MGELTFYRLALRRPGSRAMLAAENARLRALLAALVEREPTTETSADYSPIFHECGYCHQLDAHTDECPWVVARKTLGLAD